MVSYPEMRQRVLDDLSIAGIPADRFHVASTGNIGEGYFYTCGGATMRYSYTERGQVTVLCESRDPRDLEYAILQDILLPAAQAYELAHRDYYRDSRRIWIAWALEQMKKIDEDFYERLKAKYDEILAQHPFNDIESGKTAVRFQMELCLKHVPIPRGRPYAAVRRERKKLLRILTTTREKGLNFSDAGIQKLLQRWLQFQEAFTACGLQPDESIRKNWEPLSQFAQKLQDMEENPGQK